MARETERLLQEFLAGMPEAGDDDPILTLYLDVDPADRRNQAATPAWRIWLKNAITEIEADQTTRSQKIRWDAIDARVEAFLSDYRPAGKTLVLFADPGTDLALELPVAIENQAFYGRPHLADLLWAVDEYEQHLVVLLAQDQARALTLFLGQSADDVTVEAEQTWLRRERKAAHAHSIAQREDELDRRFLRYAAQQLEQYFLENPQVERIVLGGNEQMAHAVRNYLHPSVAGKVIAVLPIPFDTADHEVAHMIRSVAEQAERDYEQALVVEVVNQAKARGRGAIGEIAVNHALERHAVQLLILPYPIDPNLADDLIVKAVHSSSEVEFVHGDAADELRTEGDLAALLYYAP